MVANERCGEKTTAPGDRLPYAVKDPILPRIRQNDTESGVSNMDEEESLASQANLAGLVRHVRETDNMGVSLTKFIVSVYEVNLNRLLGKGSYGKVCLAKRQSNGKTYACKLMDIEQAPVNFVEHFLPRELEILSRLRHPNVVRVYTYVKHHSMYYIFMDHCSNGDLLRYLQRKGQSGEKLTEDESREKFIQILMGIKYLHHRQIAHRDLKCENILIDGPTLKLADFGFARFCGDPSVRRRSSSHIGRTEIERFRARDIAVLHPSDPDDEEALAREARRRSRGRNSASAQLAYLNEIPPEEPLATSQNGTSSARKRRRRPSQTTMKSTSFCGSVAYASPEVVAGEEYDPKISDMWSCGVILYILMMGKMPFDDSHPRKMLGRQRAKRYLEKIRNVLPEPGIDLIETLMEPSTTQRTTVDEAVLHIWLRPVYKKKLKHLIAMEKNSRSVIRSQSRNSTTAMDTDLVPLNDVDSSGKHMSAHSVFSVHSGQSVKSGHTSMASGQSAYSTESKISHAHDVRSVRRKANKTEN